MGCSQTKITSDFFNTKYIFFKAETNALIIKNHNLFCVCLP